jgi:hypothetical protein
MKVELLWDDSNKQASLIFESVVMTRANIHLTREQLDNTTHNNSQGDDLGPPHPSARLPRDVSTGIRG